MSDSWLEKIILGTVQFGLDYGSGEINKMPSNLEILRQVMAIVRIRLVFLIKEKSCQ